MGKYGSNNSQPQAEVPCDDFDQQSPNGGIMDTHDVPAQDAGNWTSDVGSPDTAHDGSQSIGNTPAG